MRGKQINTAIFLALIFLASSCDNSQNIESPDKNFFMKLYGDDGDQFGVDFVALSDGGFLLLGNSELSTFSGLQKRIYLVRVDALGKVVWQRLLGGMSDSARDLEPTGDGNFVILSEDGSQIDNTNTKLLRVTENGTVIDSVVYGTARNDYPKTVTPLLDGGFIITGATEYDTAKVTPVDPSLYSNIFHFRCDANFRFDPNWYELYGATDRYDAATKVFQESSNVFLVFGYSNRDHVIGQTTSKLNLQYYSIGAGGVISNNIGYVGDFDQDTRSNFVLRVPSQLGGGYFIFATETKSTGTVSMYASKLRSPLQFDARDKLLEGEVFINGRTLEAVSAAASVNSTQGYILLANEKRSIGTNIWLTKIDQIGTQLWSVSLGSEEENDRSAAVLELNDGKIMVLGSIGLADNQSKMALFKLNSVGRLQD